MWASLNCLNKRTVLDRDLRSRPSDGMNHLEFSLWKHGPDGAEEVGVRETENFDHGGYTLKNVAKAFPLIRRRLNLQRYYVVNEYPGSVEVAVEVKFVTRMDDCFYRGLGKANSQKEAKERAKLALLEHLYRDGQIEEFPLEIYGEQRTRK